LGLEAQTTAKKVRLNPIYDMRGGAGGTVDVFGRFESQIQQRSDFFLSGLAAEPTDQPDMSDQKSGTPLPSTTLTATQLQALCQIRQRLESLPNRR
jgi:hypothetical protein